MGKAKVFCKAAAQRALDTARRFAYTGIVTNVQRVYRGFRVRKQLKESKRYQREILDWMARYPLFQAENQNALHYFKSLDAIGKAIDGCNILLAKAYKAYPVPPACKRLEELLNKINQEKDLLAKMPDLLKSLDFVELDQALAVLANLKIKNADREQLQWRASQIAIQMPLIKALRSIDCSEPIAVENEKEILSVRNIIETCKETGLGEDAY